MVLREVRGQLSPMLAKTAHRHRQVRPAFVPLPAIGLTGGIGSEGIVGVTDQEQEPGPWIEPLEVDRVVYRQANFLDSPTIRATLAGGRSEQRFQVLLLGDQEVLDRGVQIRHELPGKLVLRLPLVEEVRLRPAIGESANGLTERLDQARMPERLSPDEARGQQHALQECRTGAPARRQDEDGGVLARVGQVRPPLPDHLDAGFERGLPLRLGHSLKSPSHCLGKHPPTGHTQRIAKRLVSRSVISANRRPGACTS